ncbi:MAG: GNAT family N-acetyltransferase [Candidatus Devosia phytovorans]|uniref:GNAT family N-acetyltransferase n=1 Tax=Candidatus Devosia phytovorans TaxID=3121372 RepID=A0AAJ5VVC5_9HYPH|nr:GNAT family N-acetyltransferase [Devosia sp.]WEK04232.1 MAG: GNAT family N-acetyltransferase [Devosia sp.]
MAELRRASIRDLCRADHAGDPAAIADWVGPNDKFTRLLEKPDIRLVVAEIDGTIAGLGGIQGDTVTLNYVHPDFRFRGVSKALMVTLEEMRVAAGVTTGRLHSSATALRFYHAIRSQDAGPFDPATGQPMTKRF